jgi:hypothetical protein
VAGRIESQVVVVNNRVQEHRAAPGKGHSVDLAVAVLSENERVLFGATTRNDPNGVAGKCASVSYEAPL